MKQDDTLYIISPWTSDFEILRNFHEEFSALFPKLDEIKNIRISDCLRELSTKCSVRIITVKNKTTDAFVEQLRSKAPNVEIRFAENVEHEKGVLAPNCYIEGSMNFTYSGVNIKYEKITYHSGGTLGGTEKIARANLEFDRKWKNLQP